MASRWLPPTVEVNTTTVLRTTGGHVWNAARALFTFLADRGLLEREGSGAGVSVLELGAGCGWLGLNVALNLPKSAEVVLTEQCTGGAMEHLSSNVERAAVDGARVSAVGCDWAHYSDRPVAEETGCFQPAEGTSAWTGEVSNPQSLVIIAANSVRQ